jgi:hypothetical protein
MQEQTQSPLRGQEPFFWQKLEIDGPFEKELPIQLKSPLDRTMRHCLLQVQKSLFSTNLIDATISPQQRTAPEQWLESGRKRREDDEGGWRFCDQTRRAHALTETVGDAQKGKGVPTPREDGEEGLSSRAERST